MSASLAVISPAAPPPDGGAARLRAWRHAFPAFDALIGSGVAPASALRRLGLTFWAAEESSAACEALGEAVLWAPSDAQAWLDLGFARRAAGRLADALEAFTTSAALAPEAARGWLALGLVAKETGSLGRAKSALEQALALAPGLDEAAYALGVLHFEARRYAEGAAHWRNIVARGYSAPGLRLGLGQCQFFLGEFGLAAQSLAAHLDAAPDDEPIRGRLALVSFLDGAVRGGPEGARAAHARVVGAPPILPIARAATQLLAAYGHAETALAVARAFLSEDMEDPLHRHALAALAGETAARAPAEYVAAHFDRFADTFDVQMFEVLQYCGPRKLSRLAAEAGVMRGRVLDLGCGTGAAGALLRACATRLVGVDLSAKMLAKAVERGVYDELVQDEMTDFLSERRGAFDLVFAADSLIYLGDLAPLLAAAAEALAPGGALALTLETTSKARLRADDVGPLRASAERLDRGGGGGGPRLAGAAAHVPAARRRAAGPCALIVFDRPTTPVASAPSARDRGAGRRASR